MSPSHVKRAKFAPESVNCAGKASWSVTLTDAVQKYLKIHKFVEIDRGTAKQKDKRAREREKERERESVVNERARAAKTALIRD
jgi:hypothetical protein